MSTRARGQEDALVAEWEKLIDKCRDKLIEEEKAQG